jgi:hypothetical protein
LGMGGNSSLSLSFVGNYYLHRKLLFALCVSCIGTLGMGGNSSLSLSFVHTYVHSY